MYKLFYLVPLLLIAGILQLIASAFALTGAGFSWVSEKLAGMV